MDCYVSNMFSYDYALTTINAYSTTDFSLASGSTNMFKNCLNIIGGSGTKYDANHINNAYAKIDGGESDPGYFTLRQ